VNSLAYLHTAANIGVLLILPHVLLFHRVSCPGLHGLLYSAVVWRVQVGDLLVIIDRNSAKWELGLGWRSRSALGGVDHTAAPPPSTVRCETGSIRLYRCSIRTVWKDTTSMEGLLVNLKRLDIVIGKRK
jgi:hypothetical protein